MCSQDGHYSLLILPLSIITLFCFGFLMTQPATKLNKTPPASSNPAPVAGEAAPTLPSLPYATASQLPQLSAQPTNTTSPQSSAVSLPDLQDTTDSSVRKVNISLPANHKHINKGLSGVFKDR